MRDIDEARALQFPIFTRTLTAKTARGRIVELGTNVPIRFEGVTVRPGDYAIADASAVIFIAAARYRPRARGRGSDRRQRRGDGECRALRASPSEP